MGCGVAVAFAHHVLLVVGRLMSWAAKYRGVCDYCGEQVNVGDEIVWEDRDERTIKHIQCPETDAAFIKSGEQPCPDCWLVHRGDCK